ncbi:GDSL-like Lipase/Acylhydrolase superfamily protein [Prunus dulcis]|uniref:GDSL-like Lipase/Acylhydrolase superfamily protein n=1 Tax=Prunus dulcis TaxID=3755 RepID=A0A4Y1R9Z5_PRUDU|nr:GDSL-like Lipase/Acylhydrolase superfamily protein [Prunus dulcis]
MGVIIIPLVLGCYNSVIGFGDSITDTGNLYNSDPNRSTQSSSTRHMERPTFIIPRDDARMSSNQSVQNFEAGVNFAVAGATALDAAFLEEMGFCFMYQRLSKHSTGVVQTNAAIFVQHIFRLQQSPFNFSNSNGRDWRQRLQRCIACRKKYRKGSSELIELGAATLLVPGNFPIGCLPAYLTTYESSDKNQYDPSTGCLNWLNKFSGYHNDQLQLALSRIRRLHPQVAIIYADYYNAMLQLYQSPDQFGFIGETSKACCGGGGPYNYNTSALCGDAGASACENPAQFISWDGLHSTEAAYRWITKAILQGNYTVPRVSTLCDSPV